MFLFPKTSVDNTSAVKLPSDSICSLAASYSPKHFIYGVFFFYHHIAQLCDYSCLFSVIRFETEMNFPLLLPKN